MSAITEVRRILIYRLGSLGDTIVTLPVLHLLARAFPDAERRVLTNESISNAPPMRAVLGDVGFVDGYFSYPLGVRSPQRLWSLSRQIRRWGPDLAVYQKIQRRGIGAMRDVVFLKLCGVRRIVGAPLAPTHRWYRRDALTGLWETEAARLARSASELGDSAPDDPANWDLRLTPAEEEEAERALSGWPGAEAFLAFCPGAKEATRDWGDEHWRAVLARVSAAHPRIGLAFVGGAGDRERSDMLARDWSGPTINLCGRVSLRASAVVIRRAAVYTGNNSGSAHLAAAVGTPAAIVFNAVKTPGRWFPFGAHHRVFYPGLEWSGGQPPVMQDARGETDMKSISPDQVAAACIELLRGADATSPLRHR